MLMDFVICAVFKVTNETVIPRPDLKDVFKKGLRKPQSIFNLLLWLSVLCLLTEQSLGIDTSNPSFLGDIIAFSFVFSPADPIGQITSIMY